MTQKDFELLADHFVIAWNKILDSKDCNKIDAYIITRGEIMVALKKSNPRFDGSKFIAYIAEKQENYYV